MKPLLPAPFTEEDLEAWGQVCVRFRPGGPCWWYERTLTADRRDAALMLRREVYRRQARIHKVACPVPALFWFFIVPGHLSESIP